MNTERGLGLRVCPFWKRFIAFNGYIMGLCGKESPNSTLNYDEVPRLEKCPLFDNPQAPYETPEIVEVKLDVTGQLPDPNKVAFFPWKQTDLELIPGTVVSTTRPGLEGIRYLESVWDQEVEKFIQRHSQLS